MIICFDQRNGNGCGIENPNSATLCRSCGRSLRYALELHDPDTLVQHYRIQRIIGYGNFGAVYQAEVMQRPETIVALKQSLDPADIQGFQREFQVLRHIQHPNLPAYYDMFAEEGNGYLVMEFVPGQSLQDVLIRQQGPLLESQVLGYAIQLCDVLQYLHRQKPPIIHRDIKPANIRLTPEGLIKLVDFGLVKQVKGDRTSTVRGGSPVYAALEQWSGGADIRSDVYGLGSTLYHLLTGKEPVPALDRLAASPDPLPHPGYINPRLSPHVADAVMQAMALVQKDRFSDTSAFRKALLGTTTLEPLRQPSALPDNKLGRLLLTLQGHPGGVTSVAFSPDGHFLASGGHDKTVRVWDLSIGKELYALEGHVGAVYAVAFGPGGRVLASGSHDRTIRVWDSESRDELQRMVGHTGSVCSVSFSPYGHTLMSASHDKTVRLWNVINGKELFRFEGHSHWVWSSAFSPDGKTLASGGGDKTVQLWNVQDNHTLRRLVGHTSAVLSIAFSPDGHLLASSSYDGTIRLWELPGGETRRWLDHTHWVSCIAFSPSGALLVSGSADRIVRLWDVSSGRELQQLKGHTEAVSSVAFSPDGHIVASGSEDGTVCLWRLE